MKMTLIFLEEEILKFVLEIAGLYQPSPLHYQNSKTIIEMNYNEIAYSYGIIMR